nr:hypothetical protein [Tanacetum cinerariifolium]
MFKQEVVLEVEVAKGAEADDGKRVRRVKLQGARQLGTSILQWHCSCQKSKQSEVQNDAKQSVLLKTGQEPEFTNSTARALRTADVVTHHDMAARTSKVQGAQQHLHTEQHLHTVAAVRACHTTDESTVPVSTVFDRFRELKMPRLQSNYVTHTGT